MNDCDENIISIPHIFLANKFEVLFFTFLALLILITSLQSSHCFI